MTVGLVPTRRWWMVAMAALVAMTACSASPSGSSAPAGMSASSPTTSRPQASSSAKPTALPAEAVLVAAGDIASCDSSGDEATARLVDGIAGTVAILGDAVYPDGASSDFTRCYEGSWGRHKARTRPAAGNHEYQTPGAVGYFGYFGTAAGDPVKGYYSYDLDAWHVVVVNSNCWAIGGCGKDSPQERWLRADLAESTKTCTLAYWHHPLFTSGSHHGPSTNMRTIVSALYDAGAEVVLTGHEHNYERFAPQDPSGRPDDARGIRVWVVGTGGASHYGFGPAKPNSEARSSGTYGVLKLTLRAGGYDWQFVPQSGKTFTDTGSGTCH